MTKKAAGAVVTIQTNDKDYKLFVTSDVHLDSIYCAREQMFADFDRAIAESAKIVLVGDIFDALNGRFDPRRDFSKVRPEYRREDYYDAIVDDAARLLKKYAEHIVMLMPGNHELAVLKNANTYISDRLVSKLNDMGGRVTHGHYGGWLRVVMKDGRRSMVKKIKYFHGAGGEAPVTRGAIQTNRQAVYLPDADIVLNGHSHHAYWIPITRERLSDMGKHYFDTQHHIRTPGYMQAYGDGTTGWEVTRGSVPKPLGGCLIKIRYNRDIRDIAKDVEITPWIHNPKPVNALEELFTGVVFPQE